MPLSIRRAKTLAAALLDALEVGETWDVHDADRVFNLERRWAVLVARPQSAKDPPRAFSSPAHSVFNKHFANK